MKCRVGEVQTKWGSLSLDARMSVKSAYQQMVLPMTRPQEKLEALETMVTHLDKRENPEN